MILIPTHFYDFLFFLLAESGGIIAIESSGEYSMEFNSKGMFRAVCKWWYITILCIKLNLLNLRKFEIIWHSWFPLFSLFLFFTFFHFIVIGICRWFFWQMLSWHLGRYDSILCDSSGTCLYYRNWLQWKNWFDRKPEKSEKSECQYCESSRSFRSAIELGKWNKFWWVLNGRIWIYIK